MEDLVEKVTIKVKQRIGKIATQREMVFVFQAKKIIYMKIQRQL